MKSIKYVVYKDGDYFVSQCLNVDISSFGDDAQEAVVNLKEALELYFDDENNIDYYHIIDETTIGEATLNV